MCRTSQGWTCRSIIIVKESIDWSALTLCGIAGIVRLPEGAPPKRGELERMIGAVRHRGPDGFGYYSDEQVGLAHARLSIIDLSTGDQPIANEDHSVITIFNGEIFNYVELRAELERVGHTFRTHSDTETIVHAYEEYGDRFVDHLNGQFAIALWDIKRRRFLLARDRAGIRPLFYTVAKQRLWFASEIKSLQAGGCKVELDPNGLGQVFTYWSAIGDRTVFRGIRSLPPGHTMVVEQGREPQIRAYWDWSNARPDALSGSFADAAAQLKELLIDAVRLQLRADVPVGAYLSGGLDSSGIVSLIRGYTQTQVRTFSVAFSDAEFDESEHQRRVVDFLKTDHTTIRCARSDIGKAFPKLVWHAETPVVRTAPVPLMLLSGLVRDSGYKVVLTGEGADEVFGGYDLFKEAKIRRFWARQPTSTARPALLTRLYPYLKHSPVGNTAMAGSFYGQNLSAVTSAGYAHQPRWATTRRLWNFLSPEFRGQIQAAAPEVALAPWLPPGFATLSGLGRDQYVESQTLLAGYLLSSQGDRVAMANSIEGRFPFLDHRVIEAANALPAHYKLRGLNEKAILKAALKDVLPPEIVARTKQPYRAPDSNSFFANGQPLDYVAELMSAERIRSSGYFNPAAVTQLFEKCRAGLAIGFSDNMAFVGILSAMLVDEQFVRGQSL